MACERLTLQCLDSDSERINLLTTVVAVAASVLWSFSYYHRALEAQASGHAYYAAAAAAASAAQAAAYATRTQASGSVNAKVIELVTGNGPGRCGLQGVARGAAVFRV